MKKKFFAAIAATLAGTTLCLSACTAGDSKILFGNYWNKNTEPTAQETLNETLVYDVSFEKQESSFINYELDYDGEYTTTLTSQPGNRYKFTSTLTVDVTFTVNGESLTKKDEVKSEVLFHAAGGTENLRPISSRKIITSHTPVSEKVSKPADCYQRYDYEIKTNYLNENNEWDGNATCDIIYKQYDAATDTCPEEKNLYKTYPFSANSSKRSVLDNEQFPVAFRALPAGTNAKVQMFNPFIGHSQNYVVELKSEEKEAAFTYDLTVDSVTTKQSNVTIKYRTASIVVDGTASGQPQWAYVASLQDVKTNANRNIILRYFAPLAYGMGNMKYELISATYA